MPQFGPVDWLMVFALVWTSVGSVYLESYWLSPGRFYWVKPSVKKELPTYVWNW
uniref:ATP synthase F0 subunit 8 n=1 Tax=Nipponacmea fuscoviridis TaxID=225302 RepID=A0A6B9Q9C6_9GAST|nr:ATP synthase F0 subunit 8 [Nipponacmea fuscoviridis]QHE50284.1 ATP synthase F0 subunit 8 [Nipponacmea fuscoviridis]QVH34237.1 ATP synthase F0 subunit 8 [Nipponacmea fuscoviridis]